MLENSEYQIFQIKKENYREVIDFACKYYVSQPISVALGTTPLQLEQGYKRSMIQSCQSGLSFGISKDKQILSVALVLSFSNYSQPLVYTPELQPVYQIIQQLQKTYQPKDLQRTADVFILCTHPSFTKRGLCSKLMQHLQKNAKQKGIVELAAECTNPISENIFTKFGYQVRSRAKYSEFESKGKMPFKDIKGAQSICYVTKLL